jgi:hypothetical protein
LLARTEIEAAIEQMKTAKIRNQYPTGYEEWRILSIVWFKTSFQTRIF